MADKKKKVRFKAGAELSSKVNLTVTTTFSEAQDESELLEIVLNGSKLTKADSGFVSDLKDEFLVKAKISFAEDVPTIEVNAMAKDGSKLTKADAGFVADNHNKLTKADAGVAEETPDDVK